VSLCRPIQGREQFVKPSKNAWRIGCKEAIRRVDYLHETKEHQELLYHFLTTVLLNDQCKRIKGKQLLSDYCHFSLEAYIVLTYDNGYECWKSEDSWKEDLSLAPVCLSCPVSAANCSQKNVAEAEEFTKVGQQMGSTSTKRS
jgi:hypothetical protein